MTAMRALLPFTFAAALMLTGCVVDNSTNTAPAQLADTTVLKSATSLQPGENTIKLDNAEPTSYLLVWVSTLGTVDGENRSDIAEITLKAAG